MFNILKARLFQGKLTIPFPAKDPILTERYRGVPKIDTSHCPPDCRVCMNACPMEAISFIQSETVAPTIPHSKEKNKNRKGKHKQKNEPQVIKPAKTVPKMHIDLGRCIFCNECQNACPQKSIQFTNQFKLACSRRNDLIISDEGPKLAQPLEGELRTMFHRSFKLRVVSAGDCNACNVEINVLNTLVFDLGRFGIQVVASPRHADAVVVAGPVSENMRQALIKTYNATPAPKLVIAVGSCAISGGLFREFPEVHNGAENVLSKVDLFIPGCPPHPMTILDGLVRLIDRLE